MKQEVSSLSNVSNVKYEEGKSVENFIFCEAI